MRLFVAIEPDPRARTNLTELVRRLAPMAPMRWVHPQNLHVSLKYIGDWDENRLDEVVDTLERVRIPTRVRLTLAGLGFFPHGRSPRVFWVIAENTLPLRRLAASIDARLARLGIAPEVRPYVPHVTLGRLRAECSLTEMHEAIEELPTRDFGTYSVDSFALYGSVLTKNGPVYRKIEEFSYHAPQRAVRSSRVAVPA